VAQQSSDARSLGQETLAIVEPDLIAIFKTAAA
jgi:hypothetical protein